MKTILITIALLIGLSMQGQNMYLDNYQVIDISLNDTVIRSAYQYDNDWKLTGRVKLGPNTSDSTVYVYENDTLLSYMGLYLEYYDDVIALLVDNDPPALVSRLYMHDNGDSHYRIIENEEQDYFIYEWNEMSNMTILGTDFGYGAVYIYGSYLNPLYQSKKSYKITYESSVNFIDYYVEDDGDTHVYQVVESIENYPTRVNYYINDVHRSVYIYEYNIVSDVGENILGNYTVISIDYYDIMGRKISKPEKGFYIERKTTNKGIISTKYFIQ